MDYLILKSSPFVVCLILIGYGIKHLITGRIYVGFGERYLYARTWVRREEDPILFWAIAGSLITLGLVYLFFSVSVLFFSPLTSRN